MGWVWGGGCLSFPPPAAQLVPVSAPAGASGSVGEPGSAASNLGSEMGTLGTSSEKLEVCTEGTRMPSGELEVSLARKLRCATGVPGALLGKRRVCNGETGVSGGEGGSAAEKQGSEQKSGGLKWKSGSLQEGCRGARGVPGVAAPSRGSHLLPGGGSQGLLQELPEPRVRGGGRDGAEGQDEGQQG